MMGLRRSNCALLVRQNGRTITVDDSCVCVRGAPLARMPSCWSVIGSNSRNLIVCQKRHCLNDVTQ